MRGFKPWARGLAALLPCTVLVASCGSPIGDGTRLSKLDVQSSSGGSNTLNTPECVTNGLTAIGTFSGDGSDTLSNMTGRVTWESSDPEVVYVGDGFGVGKPTTSDGVQLAPGQFVGLKPGQVTVTARFKDTYTAQISVTVLPIDALRVIPDNSTLTDVGEFTSVPLELQARLQPGQPFVNITPLAVWAMADNTDQGAVSLNGIFTGAISDDQGTPVTVQAKLPGCERTATRQLIVSSIDHLSLSYESDNIPSNIGLGTVVMPLGYSDVVHVFANFNRPGSLPQEISGEVTVNPIESGLLTALPDTSGNTGITVGAVGNTGTEHITINLTRNNFPTLQATTRNWNTQQLVLQSLAVNLSTPTIHYPDTGLVSATGTFDGGVQWPLTRFVSWTSDPATLAVQGAAATDTPTGTITSLTANGTIAHLTATTTNTDAVTLSQLVNVTVTPGLQ